MAGAADAKDEQSKKKPKRASKGKPADGAPARAQAGGGEGPSVATHPRASLHVARAKGWGGLIGFLLGGYLSLPTSTLAVAGLRALLAGLACYLAGWAGAVFVWRHLVMLQIAGAREGTREGLSPSPLGSRGDATAPYRRENVRVRAERPVVAYVGANRSRVQTFTIDISAGGLLVGGLEMLGRGEPFEFQLTLSPHEPPVTGIASVVRTDPQGRCAVAFESIGEREQKRLVQFIFDYQRSELAGAPAG